MLLDLLNPGQLVPLLYVPPQTATVLPVSGFSQGKL